jgi:hypothetical protein
MASFTITPVEKGIMRCQHTGSFNHEDIRTMTAFFNDYRGKLLVDLRGASAEDCEKQIRHLRPMMPSAAIFGAKINPAILEIPESYYANPVQYFENETDALIWLREQ